MDATARSAPHAPPAARRCHARSKRSGERCRRLAIPGGTVCVMHGGAAPQVAAAAKRRLSDAAVRELVPVMCRDVDLASLRAPEEHPADVTRAFARMQRARARQPRWWKAVEARAIDAEVRAWARELADAVDPPTAE